MSGDTGYKIWSWLYMSYLFRCCLGFILKIMCFVVVLAYLSAVANEFECNLWEGKGMHIEVHRSGYCNMGTEANVLYFAVDCIWNVMAHAQKPDFVFRRNGRVQLNWRGRQFSRLLAAEVCASAVVMMDTPCSKVVWRVLATHPICQFPLHFPSHVSPCAITFQLDSNNLVHTIILCENSCGSSFQCCSSMGCVASGCNRSFSEKFSIFSIFGSTMYVAW
jgi:hypothetical protein